MAQLSLSEIQAALDSGNMVPMNGNIYGDLWQLKGSNGREYYKLSGRNEGDPQDAAYGQDAFGNKGASKLSVKDAIYRPDYNQDYGNFNWSPNASLGEFLGLSGLALGGLGAFGGLGGATGGTGSLATGDAMAGLIPSGEVGAWAGAGTGAAGAAGSKAMDFSSLGDYFGGSPNSLGSGMYGLDGALTSGSYVDPFSMGSITGSGGLGVVTPEQLASMSAITGMDTSGLATAIAGAGGQLTPGILDMLSKAPGGISSALKSIFGGSGSSGGTDWSRLLGGLGAAGLGAYASNKQTNALTDMANRYEGYGAPYRQRLSDLYQDPTSFLSSKEVTVPVDQGTQSLMRSLSTQGNPFGSGNALQQGQSYASDQLFGRLGQEKDRLAGFGGLSSYNQAAPSASVNAITSGSNAWNAAGSGMNNIFNPPQTPAQQAADWMKVMGK